MTLVPRSTETIVAELGVVHVGADIVARQDVERLAISRGVRVTEETPDTTQALAWFRKCGFDTMRTGLETLSPDQLAALAYNIRLRDYSQLDVKV